MKMLGLILLSIIYFFGYFFLFSLVGLLWVDGYKLVISNVGWFFLYSICLGWWLTILSVIPYYNRFEFYFKDLFKHENTC